MSSAPVLAAGAPRAALLALDSSSVSAGPLGLLVVLLMVIATVLLIRSMNARLRRLPREFPEQQQGPDETTPGDRSGG